MVHVNAVPLALFFLLTILSDVYLINEVNRLTHSLVLSKDMIVKAAVLYAECKNVTIEAAITATGAGECTLTNSSTTCVLNV